MMTQYRRPATNRRHGAQLLSIAIFVCPLYAVNLQALLDRADIVIEGRASQIVRSGTGVVTTVRVERMLKGTLGRQLIRVEIAPFRAGASALVAVREECGLWFLLPSDSGSWKPVSKQPDSIYFPLPECSTASRTGPFEAGSGASLLDRIGLEIAAAAESFGGKRGYSGGLYSVLLNTSPEVRRQVAGRFSSSGNPDLLAIGLSLLTGLQEPEALRRLEAEAGRFAQSHARSGIHRAILQYRSPDPLGVAILGRIATGQSSPQAAIFAAAAVAALENIHTREAVPHLVQLLDHSDPGIRARAVAGLSVYRLGIAPGVSAQEAEREIEARMNPGTTPLSERDREYVHRGRFVSSTEEAAHINFYKRWWTENRARLGL